MRVKCLAQEHRDGKPSDMNPVNKRTSFPSQIYPSIFPTKTTGKSDGKLVLLNGKPS